MGRVNRLYEKILDFAPKSTQPRLAYARALARAERYEDALAQVDQMLGGDHEPSTRAGLLHLRGDLSWQLGRPQKAASAYEECLGLGVPDDARRLLEVKLDALSRASGDPARFAYEYLLGQKPSSVSLYYPMRWHQQMPEDPLASYLVGRRLWLAHEWEPSLSFLQHAERDLEDGILRSEARRMLARAHYFLGDIDRAERLFEVLRGDERSFYRLIAAEWRDRIAWKRGNRIRTQ